MLTSSPLFSIAITLIRANRGAIVVEAHGLVRRGRYPTCGTTSARVHDHYRRHLVDLP